MQHHFFARPQYMSSQDPVFDSSFEARFLHPRYWFSWLALGVLIAGVSTLLVNGNPLMRYDGYFIACDLLEVPNLGQRVTRGHVPADLHLIPTLWFRNTWSWANGGPKPILTKVEPSKMAAFRSSVMPNEKVSSSGLFSSLAAWASVL